MKILSFKTYFKMILIYKKLKLYINKLKTIKIFKNNNL